VKAPKLTYKKANSLLLLLIILLNLYVIITPYVPALLFHWQNRGGTKKQALEQVVKQPAPVTAPTTSQPNHIVIPSMLLDTPVYEGSIADTYKVLDKGVWRWPGGSTPDKGSNTVMLAHRFTYTNPRGTFYYLNKVNIGDELAVYYNNRKFVYKVVSISEVSPSDTAIEAPSSTPELTLYTCTPLWLPHDRLVVVANLEGKV
jgi:LPXTG-site transpeptidase (sortase) family protein